MPRTAATACLEGAPAMTRRLSPLAAAAGLVLLLGGMLTACATPAGSESGSGVSPSGSSSAPAATGGSDDATGGDDADVDAAWLDGGRLIGVVTYGSSTCVPEVGEVTLDGAVLTVELIDDAEAACTRDFVPRVNVVGAADIDPTQKLEVRVTGDAYAGDADLDALPADLVGGAETDYLPSAGWTDEDGQFVILTWGSSGCPPEIASVEATGATEVTATFVDPPADQVCTMDMAPRALVAAVAGVEDEDALVELVLTGGEFTGQRATILPN